MTPLRDEQRRFVDDVAYFRDLVSDLEPLGLKDRRGRPLLDPSVGPLKALSELAEEALEMMFAAHDIRTGAATVKVAVVGDFNAGKSTLINALLGRPLCPTDCEPTTSRITYFEYGEELQIRQEVLDRAGTPKDEGPVQVSLEEYQELARHPRDLGSNSKTARLRFRVECPSPVLRDITLIDTPGFGSHNSLDTPTTEAAARAADVLLLVMNIHRGQPSGDVLKTLARIRGEEGHDAASCILLLNQADRMKVKRKRADALADNRRRHGDLFDEVLLTSATRLQDGPEVEFARHLRSVGESLREAVRERLPFAVSAGGTDRDGAYVVSLDGREYRLQGSRWADLASREQLLAVVERIRSRRNELLLRGFEERKARYLGHRKATLASLARTLRGATQARESGDVVDHAGLEGLEERVSKLVERASTGLSRSGAQALKKSFGVESIPKDEHWYAFSPYARVIFTTKGLSGRIRGLNHWKEVSKELRSLASVAEADWNVAFDAAAVLSAAKKFASDFTVQLVKELAEGFAEEYESAEDAHLAIELQLDIWVSETPNYLASRLVEGLSVELLSWIDQVRVEHGRQVGVDDAAQRLVARVLEGLERHQREADSHASSRGRKEAHRRRARP